MVGALSSGSGSGACWHGIGVAIEVLSPPRGLQLDLQPDAVGVIEIEGLAVFTLDDLGHRLHINKVVHKQKAPEHKPSVC